MSERGRNDARGWGESAIQSSIARDLRRAVRRESRSLRESGSAVVDLSSDRKLTFVGLGRILISPVASANPGGSMAAKKKKKTVKKKKVAKKTKKRR
jgi:hypothetical protein